MSAKRSISRVLSGLFLSGAALTATLLVVPALPGFAQTNQGVTIFGGVDSEYRLPYTLRNNQPRSRRAEYYLRVPGNRMASAAAHLRISYPEAFTERRGAFDTDQIKVRQGRGRGSSEIPIQEVVWSPESSQIDIYLAEDIPADTSFVVAMTGIRNPDRFGMQRFNLQAESRGDVLPRYLGTWELLVAEEMGSR
ncbi:MAG: hypothetical protein DCF15_04735 [Phormidesmis priestleyi]|uniref:DUF2808 domain-containing protein n=1 Tax=Phormidesmis priestleyi TaxID=268141 RepID=A0A2W4ZJ99_9CYAN|nr:MAG: hypothetical protein DCF15_04735 [Phormidesmis priestleyi]